MNPIFETVDLASPKRDGYFTRVTLDGPTVTVVDRHTDGNELTSWSHTFTTDEGFTDPQGYAITSFKHEVSSRISTGFSYPSRSRSVVGESYEGERERITRDMKRAASLPFGEYVGFLGNYGATIANLADAYTSPEVAHSILARHADDALEEVVIDTFAHVADDA